MIHDQLRPLAVPLSSLASDAANARQHDERNINAIIDSLAAFGQRKPVVVQKSGMIVRAGNGTVEAARRLGWKEIAAIVIDDDTATAEKYAIADNRTGDLATWDDAQLVRLLNQWTEDDQAALGWTPKDIDSLLQELGTEFTFPDTPPAVQQPSATIPSTAAEPYAPPAVGGGFQVTDADIQRTQQQAEQIGHAPAERGHALMSCPHCGQSFEVRRQGNRPS